MEGYEQCKANFESILWKSVIVWRVGILRQASYSHCKPYLKIWLCPFCIKLWKSLPDFTPREHLIQTLDRYCENRWSFGEFAFWDKLLIHNVNHTSKYGCVRFVFNNGIHCLISSLETIWRTVTQISAITANAFSFPYKELKPKKKSDIQFWMVNRWSFSGCSHKRTATKALVQ